MKELGKLLYNKDGSGSGNADRAILYPDDNINFRPEARKYHHPDERRTHYTPDLFSDKPSISQEKVAPIIKPEVSSQPEIIQPESLYSFSSDFYPFVLSSTPVHGEAKMGVHIQSVSSRASSDYEGIAKFLCHRKEYVESLGVFERDQKLPEVKDYLSEVETYLNNKGIIAEVEEGHSGIKLKGYTEKVLPEKFRLCIEEMEKINKILNPKLLIPAQEKFLMDNFPNLYGVGMKHDLTKRWGTHVSIVFGEKYAEFNRDLKQIGI